MWQRAFYHEGMSELQDRFDGRRVAEAIERHRKHYEFWDDEKALIETRRSSSSAHPLRIMSTATSSRAIPAS
jgi:hypothetical protein